jgi:ribosome-binding protein aMBF1 (putative translation factor)
MPLLPLSLHTGGGLTPTHFRECLDAVQWSQRGIARHLGRHEGTVRQWARGSVTIPDDVAAWLERLARFHTDNPAPMKAESDQLERTNP